MPFGLGDPTILAELLQHAGFVDVSVEPAEIVADYARPREYIALQVRASSAGIAVLQGRPAAELDAIIAAVRDDMAAAVREATVGDRLRFPMRGIVARGFHA